MQGLPPHLAGSIQIRFKSSSRVTVREYSVMPSLSSRLITLAVIYITPGEWLASAYDCEFAALAMLLGTKLMTMDAKLLKAFPMCAVALMAG